MSQVYKDERIMNPEVQTQGFPPRLLASAGFERGIRGPDPSVRAEARGGL